MIDYFFNLTFDENGNLVIPEKVFVISIEKQKLTEQSNKLDRLHLNTITRQYKNKTEKCQIKEYCRR